MRLKLTATILFFLGLFFLFYFKDYFSIQSSVSTPATLVNSSEQVVQIVATSLSQIENYDGAELNLSQLLSYINAENTTRVFHFWASWCDPCLNEIPDFISFVKKTNVDSQSKKQIQFYLVSLDYESEDIKKFIRVFPEISSDFFIQLWDKENVLSKKFSVDKLPMTIISYPNGKVVFYHGVVPWKDFQFTE